MPSKQLIIIEEVIDRLKFEASGSIIVNLESKAPVLRSSRGEAAVCNQLLSNISAVGDRVKMYARTILDTQQLQVYAEPRCRSTKVVRSRHTVTSMMLDKISFTAA